ncbi:MAG: hypothetical protein KKH92_01200 [Firmicutes bacterium]|nr:hypothetical protein [Bacillota bacterium]
MSNSYKLSAGTYFIGDPAMMIKKTKEGDQFITTLWDLFYKDMNQFQKLVIDGVTLFITRTAEGDGLFGDVGTDTGTICIMRLEDITKDDRFNANAILRGCHYINVDQEDQVTVANFNIRFDSGYQVITNFEV